MNQVKTCKTEWNELENLINEYFTELGFKNDGFLNSMILEGEAYKILINDILAGFFSVGHSWDDGKMLRTFYLLPGKRVYSMEIFEEVMKEFEIEAALVASNDSHLVSLAFEKMNALKTTFDMQAFNFIYGEPSHPAEFGMEYMVPLNPEECKIMESLTDGQWDGCAEDSAFTFYAIKKDEKVLGYGGIYQLQHSGNYVDVGNFTMPEYRKQGVGRSLIINLSKIAFSNGNVPVAGCWYGNKNSIATLKSSGYIPQNRIFYVRFK